MPEHLDPSTRKDYTGFGLARQHVNITSIKAMVWGISMLQHANKDLPVYQKRFNCSLAYKLQFSSPLIIF